jgi:hypothetical protein
MTLAAVSLALELAESVKNGRRVTTGTYHEQVTSGAFSILGKPTGRE